MACGCRYHISRRSESIAKLDLMGFRSGFMRNDVVDANRHLQSEKTKQEFHAMLKQKREDYQRIAEASFCLYVYKRSVMRFLDHFTFWTHFKSKFACFLLYAMTLTFV